MPAPLECASAKQHARRRSALFSPLALSLLTIGIFIGLVSAQLGVNPAENSAVSPAIRDNVVVLVALLILNFPGMYVGMVMLSIVSTDAFLGIYLIGMAVGQAIFYWPLGWLLEVVRQWYLARQQPR